MNPLRKVKGSIHSHGCWTDYRNPNEQSRFPFNLEAFVRHCIACGRDFQAVTDIMASHSGNRNKYPDSPPFVEQRFKDILGDAPQSIKENLSPQLVEFVFSNEKGYLVIPRTQEILTSVPFMHVLAANCQEDIVGGLPPIETLRKVKELQGFSIIDHPFLRDAWKEDELKGLYKDGLIDALEWNGGLSWPSFFPTNFPSKKANIRLLKMEESVPIIANDDSHSADDIKRGATTTYEIIDNQDIPLVKRIFEAIRLRRYKRNEDYSSRLSPLMHVYYGSQSQKCYQEIGLPSA